MQWPACGLAVKILNPAGRLGSPLLLALRSPWTIALSTPFGRFKLLGLLSSLFIRVLILGASSLHPHIIWIVEHPFMRICVSVPCIMYLYLTTPTTYCCPTHHPCCRTLPFTLYPPPTCSSIALLLPTLSLRASIKWNGVPFAGTYTRTCGSFELAANSMVSSFVGTWYAGQAEPWHA